MYKASDIDDYIRSLVMAFSAENPDIKLSVNLRDGTYIVRLDYSFSNLDAEQQRKGRHDINILMQTLHKLQVSTWLELGEVV